jgi:predicted Zn-dependent protease
MHVVRLFACSLVLSAVALASNGPLPQSASIDTRNAIEKADAAFVDGDRQLALALYKGSLLASEVKIAVDQETLDHDDQYRAVYYALQVWHKELNGDFPVVLVDRVEDADVVVKFVDSIPERGADALGLIQIEKSYRWSKSMHSVKCKGSISIVRSAVGGRLTFGEMRDVVMHEIGHLLGLGDIEKTGVLMGPLERGKPLSRPTTAEVEDVKSLRQTLRSKIRNAEASAP